MTVALEDLTIRYGRHTAVSGATATFPPGAVGLLGRNGAGKSSILRALLGLVRPVSGSLRVLDLPADTPAVERRRRLGYMPERDAHVPGLNGYEAVRLAGQLSGLPAAVAARRAHEVLYLVGLEDQRYRAVAGYSAGMRQKVKLAGALVHDPEVLFLDEPTNGLDPRGRREMLGLVRRLARDLGKSVILSSHILSDVEATCDSVVVLELGRVVAAGGLEELTHGPERHYLLRASGVGDLAGALEAIGARVVGDAGEDVRVALPEGTPTAVLFRAVRDAGGEVRQLRRRRRSLEEVFLGAVSGGGVR